MGVQVYGKLTVIAGPDRGKEMEFPSGKKIVIGRDPGCHIQLADAEISRLHCEINHEEDGFYVTDLNSRNGTLVGDERITKAKLHDGFIIELGVTRLEFRTRVQREARVSEKFHEPAVAAIRRPSAKLGATKPTQAKPVEAEKDPFEGRILGDFKIISRLGGSDSTYVYKAIQQSKNRLVALKVLPPEMAINKSAMKRFVRGAKSGSQLRHPNIVRILGGGMSEGVYYIWMEYVEGQSLRALMEAAGPRGRMDARTTLNIAIQICEALVVAHEKRIVHRNIKPGNILISKDGVAKLGDLGLAKTVEEQGGSDITDPGTILGTLNYMSPEQIQDAGVVDHRSDIYSLGASMYTMVTGVEPFAAPTTLDIIIHIQKTQVEPVAKYNPDLPEEIGAIIHKAMAKDPNDRQQSPQELLDALRQARQALGK